MPEFNPDAPVVIEKVSGGGRMRQFSFPAGRFDSIDAVQEYLNKNASGGYDIGEYEIRQPITTLSVSVENEFPYSDTEQKWLADAIQDFETTFGVIETERIDASMVERQASRKPYEMNISYRNCDLSVTVNADQYDYETVEETLLNQVSPTARLFFEGKTENFERGDTSPSSFTLFFAMERQQGQVDKARHLYHKMRQIAQQTERVDACLLLRDIAVGTTHSYVLGGQYPEDTVVVDLRAFDADEETFLDDVLFTTDKTESEAFHEIRGTLEQYTNETKEVYSELFAPFINNLQYETEILGAGEYSSGSTNRLLLGIRPSST